MLGQNGKAASFYPHLSRLSQAQVLSQGINCDYPLAPGICRGPDSLLVGPMRSQSSQSGKWDLWSALVGIFRAKIPAECLALPAWAVLTVVVVIKHAQT